MRGQGIETSTVAAVVDAIAARTVWARAHVRDLEDMYASGARRPDSPIAKDLADRIVAVSLAHRVLCRFTAYIAIDPEHSVRGGDAESVVQPVEMPSGWQHATTALRRGGPHASAASFGAGPFDMMSQAPLGAAPVPPAAMAGGALRGNAPAGSVWMAQDQGAQAAVPGPVEISAYHQRIDDLLERVEQRTLGAEGAEELADAVAELGEDLESIGAAVELVEALRILAAAIRADADSSAAVSDVRAQLRGAPTGGGPRRSWWRG